MCERKVSKFVVRNEFTRLAAYYVGKGHSWVCKVNDIKAILINKDPLR